MKGQIKVIKPETKAVIKHGNIEGIITAVMIRSSGVRYGIAFYDQGIKEQYFDRPEFSVGKEAKTITIGFHTDGN